jgi:hypothetical protein
MITLALLLAGIGTADAMRALRSDRRPFLPTLAAAALVVAGTLAAGVAWWWAIIIVTLVVFWLAGTAERRHPRIWPIVMLAAAIAAAFAAVPALPKAGGVLLEWYEWLPYDASVHTPFDTFALAVGGVLLMLETANVVVRIVLRRTAPEAWSAADVPQATRDNATAVPRRRTLRLPFGRARRSPAAPLRETAAGAAVSSTVTLKGGRIIGPLERLFILALALGGQFVAIGAVIAAKGIIRFPEISKDEPGGSKAEYFLVGSFTSWAFVLVLAVLVHLSRH